MRHSMPGEDPIVSVEKLARNTPEEPRHEPWHTIKVVLVTAIVFAFFSYVVYVTRG